MPRKTVAKPVAKPVAEKISKKTSKEVHSENSEPVEVPVVDEKLPLELIEEQFHALTTKLQELRSMEVSLMSDLKALQKSTLKHMKTKNKKKKRVVGDKKNRAPSGFAKPTKMSQELCKFLGKPDGTEMARTEVTKFITKYVKENDLQNPENRREIKCDSKLRTLLNVGDDVPVTYFNLQKYMKVHFMKAEPVVVV